MINPEKENRATLKLIGNKKQAKQKIVKTISEIITERAIEQLGSALRELKTEPVNEVIRGGTGMENTRHRIPQEMQTRQTKSKLGNRNGKTSMGKREIMEEDTKQLHAKRLQLQASDTRQHSHQ